MKESSYVFDLIMNGEISEVEAAGILIGLKIKVMKAKMKYWALAKVNA